MWNPRETRDGVNSSFPVLVSSSVITETGVDEISIKISRKSSQFGAKQKQKIKS